MNAIDKLREYTLEASSDYSAEINNIISAHNMAIDIFAGNLANSTLMQLLIQKGIITDTEYYDLMNTISEHSSVNFIFKQYEKAYDHIVELIEAEKAYLKDITTLHDNLDDSNDFSSEEVSSDIIDDIFNSAKE